MFMNGRARRLGYANILLAERQMAQREQAIEGVLRIQVIVRPVAVKAPLRAPQRIEKIEAQLSHWRGQRSFEAGERMQRGGGGQEVWNRRAGNRHEASFRVDLAEKKLGGCPAQRNSKLVEKGHGCSGGIGRA